MQYQYKTKGTCSQAIFFEIEDGKLKNVQFMGGCNGNLKAISRVVDGMTVEQIESYFKGIDCNGKGTSCSDQLATVVRHALDSQQKA